MNNRIFLILSLAFFSIGGAALPVHAANPSVTSFTVSPTSVGYGQLVGLSWALDSAQGSSLTVFCPSGIQVTNFNTQSKIPCGTPTVISNSGTDSVGLQILNLTGTTKTFTLRLTPRDLNGDYAAGSADATISVVTSPAPIYDLSVASTSVSSGAPQTISWGGRDTSGANLIVDCHSELTLTSGNQTLPCGNLAFTSAQGAPGAAVITFTNSSMSSVSVTITVLPSIDSSTYDATHSVSTSFTVNGKITSTSPELTLFTADTNRIISRGTATLSWSGVSIAGANLKLDCVPGITVGLATTTGITPLACDNSFYALSGNLPPTGSTTLTIANISYGDRSLTAYLIPQLNDGTYDATKSKQIVITVLPSTSLTALIATSTSIIATSSISSTNTQAITTTTLPTTNMPSTASPKGVLVFTKLLGIGSRGDQVTKLQTYLKADSTLYPEGIVSGYFGPATTRAIARFQVKYGIAKKGNVGYGTLGPKTRAKLNSLQ